MILGQPKFTGLAIGEIAIDKMSPTMKIKVKAAFVDPATGATHGWTNAEGSLWSKETLETLAALITSMENDLGAIHFAGGPTNTPIFQSAPTTAPGGGLGEHIGGDAPSV